MTLTSFALHKLTLKTSAPECPRSTGSGAGAKYYSQSEAIANRCFSNGRRWAVKEADQGCSGGLLTLTSPAHFRLVPSGSLAAVNVDSSHVSKLHRINKFQSDIEDRWQKMTGNIKGRMTNIKGKAEPLSGRSKLFSPSAEFDQF